MERHMEEREEPCFAPLCAVFDETLDGAGSGTPGIYCGGDATGEAASIGIHAEGGHVFIEVSVDVDEPRSHQ